MEPRPGWFPDVTQPQKKRWWDGARWTEHRRDLADLDDTPPPPTERDRATGGPTPAAWEAEQMPAAGPQPRLRPSGRALASVVFGTLWIFGVGSLIGIILAVAALREVGRSRGLVGGRIVAWLGLAISLFTLSLTVLLVVQFDEVVDTVKVDVVDESTRRELRDAAAAMESHREENGTFPKAISDLAGQGFTPEVDVSVVIARATATTWCLEALHQDADRVWHLRRGGEPTTGRC